MDIDDMRTEMRKQYDTGRAVVYSDGDRVYLVPGMRDQFAMAALVALQKGIAYMDLESRADDAYELADAMLKARKIE